LGTLLLADVGGAPAADEALREELLDRDADEVESASDLSAEL